MGIRENLGQKVTFARRQVPAWQLGLLAVAMLVAFGGAFGVLIGLAAGFDAGLVIGLVSVILVTTVAAPHLIHHGLWAVVLLAYFVAAWMTDGQTAAVAFYEQASQVVPVSFLALAVYVSQTGGRSLDSRWWAAFSLAALLLAEYVCLKVVAEDDASGSADLSLVAGALAAAGTGLLLSILTSAVPAKLRGKQGATAQRGKSGRPRPDDEAESGE